MGDTVTVPWAAAVAPEDEAIPSVARMTASIGRTANQ